jgi:hypothetical protein
MPQKKVLIFQDFFAFYYRSTRYLLAVKVDPAEAITTQITASIS